LDDRLIRSLKVFVVAGGVVLVLGTGLLVWLLVQRATTTTGGDRQPIAATVAAPGTLALPAGATIGQVLSAGNQLVIVGEGPDGRFLAVVDLATGRRRHLLKIVPEVP
jgi:hypothetical protein